MASDTFLHMLEKVWKAQSCPSNQPQPTPGVDVSFHLHFSLEHFSAFLQNSFW